MLESATEFGHESGASSRTSEREEGVTLPCKLELRVRATVSESGIAKRANARLLGFMETPDNAINDI